MILDKLFSRMRSEPTAEQNAYLQIVAQARQSAFYIDSQVPDTVDGRFDMIVLHACLLMRRLGAENTPEALGFSQNVFDEMFLDMDRSLREMGVGDISVGKKVKKMAQAFYGRAAAYDEGLSCYLNEPEALVEAVRRNIFPGSETSAGAEKIARYMVEAAGALEGQSAEALLSGEVIFPDAETAF